MKRRIAGMLILITMVLCCLISVASADTEATLNPPSYYGGFTTVSWNVSGDDAGSYQLAVMAVNNGSATQTRWNMGTTSNHSMQITECIPGKTYEFLLLDGDGYILDRKEYAIPQTGVFEDGKLKNTSVRITLTPRQYVVQSQKFNKLNNLNAQEITDGFSNGNYYYGLKYEMRMPQLAKPRSFFVTLAFESPEGYLYVEKAEDVNFDRVNNGYQTIWWELSGIDFLDNLLRQTGYIPRGEYTIYLYWDGLWVNTSTFRVN